VNEEMSVLEKNQKQTNRPGVEIATTDPVWLLMSCSTKTSNWIRSMSFPSAFGAGMYNTCICVSFVQNGPDDVGGMNVPDDDDDDDDVGTVKFQHFRVNGRPTNKSVTFSVMLVGVSSSINTCPDSPCKLFDTFTLMIPACVRWCWCECGGCERIGTFNVE